MPNIIEQQDLLKGLPDARLALLMQKPDASIPPFLVAAEAQRRQAIRQQFSGDGSKESVVDTLAKQLSNVPQNIQAPMQTPPNIPQPQMGIAALQQPQQPQQMAAGGAVEPMWNIPNYGGALPKVADWVGSTARGIYDYATTPWGEQKASGPVTSVSDANLDFSLPDKKLPGARPEFSLTGEPATYTDLTAKPKKPVDPNAGKAGTSTENKYKAMEADMRERLEALYADEEPSNWEEAQKWFAMSAQIMNPDANLLQGLASAGAVYAGAEGEQARQRREGDRALQEALLNYDMQIMQSDRAAAAAAAKEASDREFELLKMRTPEASSAIRAYGDLIESIDKKLEDPMGMMDETTKKSLISQRQMYEMQLANIMRGGGFGASGVITRDQLP